jgi:hypothetical protein
MFCKSHTLLTFCEINLLFVDDYRFLPNREEAQEAQFDKFADQVGDSKLVIVEIGAGQGVPTVRMLGESL